jgi:predicted nucleotidyltransferase
MLKLTEDQAADLRTLRDHCRQLNADLVVIGAIAYQIYFPKEYRHTADFDFAVALDLNEFAELDRKLASGGWKHPANQEHQWRSPHGTRLDLIPAGPKLREAGQIDWPTSQLTMCLVGFNHVFTEARPVLFADNLMLKVAPAVVLALLKMVAFLDDPTRRAKDLGDLRGMLQRYEVSSERLFSDDVLNANLEDYSLSPAFLLGADLRALCTDEEVTVVNRFFSAIDDAKPGWMSFVRARSLGDHAEEDARAELKAFKQGFDNRL